MCTSIFMKGDVPLYGRNMDLYYELDFRVVTTPRNYPFYFRMAGKLKCHHAMIGMAVVKDGYPLYCEAANEHGLYMAGLDFPDNAYYSPEPDGEKINISPFELIPFILGQCKDITEVKEILSRVNVTAVPFDDDMPLSPLHWHIADRKGSVVFETTERGQHIYDDPVNVMTNNPPFDFHLLNLAHYVGLSNKNPESDCEGIGINPFSFGFGAVGLPGDFSSSSRFVKASFVLGNSVCESDAESRISQFFHVLSSVAMPRGSVEARDGANDVTVYSCCIDAEHGVYYYNTYGNVSISAVRMKEDELLGDELLQYNVSITPEIKFLN
ncbi:MAG: choloylglycine hydrolase family protein [Ruminococcaceae bacterium]|nr:choloylglycine hydrolase family protein [Oscillospiraceae bacterium]